MEHIEIVQYNISSLNEYNKGNLYKKRIDEKLQENRYEEKNIQENRYEEIEEEYEHILK